MLWNEVKIIFESEDKETAADLISNIFFDLGLQGVVVESPEINPEDDWCDKVENRPKYNSVAGYLPDNDTLEENRLIIEEELIHLKKSNKIKYKIISSQIDEEDWAESWKEFFWPIKVSNRIVVKPTWREYDKKPGEKILEIDPGMAFGTGTHPTTFLCIQMLEKYLAPGDSMLDIGTGSGILLIAASLLGAEKLTGVDTDALAVKITEQNLLLNKIAKEKFLIKRGSIANVADDKFNIVTANILADVIIDITADVKKHIIPDGIFICSGIIEKKVDAVVSKMKTTGFTIIDICVKDKWAAITGRNSGY